MPRKQDPYATAGQKVVGLYSLLLFTGRAYSLGQLARLFGCSKQTVLRMVEQIEMTHRLRLRAWVEGRERWYRAETPRERPNVSLTVEEIQQLLLCRDIVWHWLPRQLREDVEGTIAKAAVLLPDYEGREDALRPLAGARPKGIVDYSGSQDQVEAVMRGLRERRVCEVAYHSPERKQPKVMAVAPYQLPKGFHLESGGEPVAQERGDGRPRRERAKATLREASSQRALSIRIWRLTTSQGSLHSAKRWRSVERMF
jgi:hypothetical protein